MMRATIYVGLLALVGCAGTSRQLRTQTAPAASPEAKAAEEQEKKDQARLVCNWEVPTGSHIPEKVCRMPEQIEHDRDEAQQIMDTLPQVQTKKG
ncbi:MAG: hypothetical protein ACJ79H_10595 [Myxococcales bacterium]